MSFAFTSLSCKMNAHNVITNYHRAFNLHPNWCFCIIGKWGLRVVALHLDHTSLNPNFWMWKSSQDFRATQRNLHVECSEAYMYSSWRTYLKNNLLAQADSVYRHHWDQMFPLSGFFPGFFFVCSINLNQLKNGAIYMQAMIHYWWPVHERSRHVQFTPTGASLCWMSRIINCLYCCEWLIVVHGDVVAAADQTDDKVCERATKKAQKVTEPHVPPPSAFFLLLSSPFSYFSACGWHGSPLLAPLHSSCRVLGWELISAAVWARDGSEDGEGAGDAERDLMRMYGYGCTCVCVHQNRLTGG